MVSILQQQNYVDITVKLDNFMGAVLKYLKHGVVKKVHGIIYIIARN